MKKKSGQFKIQQMAFMLLAIVLFFVLVGLFWIMLQSKSLHEQATYLEENKAILMSQFISGSSEFTCGSYCIDADRLLILQNKTTYSEFWPVSYIKIRKLYPKKENEQDKICNSVNYPDCNIFSIYENKQIKGKSSVGSYVALCRIEQVEGYPTKICDLGKISIGYEIK